MKISRKQLKAALASGVSKLGPASVALNLCKFLLFDYFLDLAKFWDLDIFVLSDFLVFGSICFDPSLDASPFPTSPNLLAASTLAPSISLAASTCDDMIVLSIDVSGAAILLQSLMN